YLPPGPGTWLPAKAGLKRTRSGPPWGYGGTSCSRWIRLAQGLITVMCPAGCGASAQVARSCAARLGVQADRCSLQAGALDRIAGVLKIGRCPGRPGRRWAACLPERPRVGDNSACGVGDEQQYGHIV